MADDVASLFRSSTNTMNHQVLARKWRPRNFQEMVAQPHVVKALINALNQNRLHHAYLFTGTRGVGKTSIARILAKCLNCVQGVSATPCDNCDACLAINAGQFVDLIEVDAASRTKVEDTRELLSNTHYAPSSGRYKIYLIDEVHMLSGHSFNALLKTLEEPPAHVKFLLATTDPQKLPATILSRCLQFHLKHMPAQEIAEHLGEILTKEQIQYEQAALHTLAHAADGSMRDALSLLDQAIAYGNNAINSQEVIALLGNTPNHHLIDIIYHLHQHNPEKLLATVANLHEQSIDFNRTLEGLLALLHQIAILQIVPDAIIDDYWQEPEPIRQLASTLSAAAVQLYYQIALIGRRDLPLASNPKNGFEMVLLRMLAFDPLPSTQHHHLTEAVTPPSTVTPPNGGAQSNFPDPAIRRGDNTKAQSGNPKVRGASTEVQGSSIEGTEPSPGAVACSVPANSATDQQHWPSLLSKLGLSGMTHTLATHCSLQSIIDGIVSLSLAPKHAPLLTPKQQERLAQALSDHFNKPMRVEISIAESTQASPAQLSQQKEQQKQVAAEQTLKADDNIQNLIEQFDATLIPESIEPRDDEA